MEVVERPQTAEVEDRPEVDEERVVARPGEHLAVAAEIADALERVVRRVRARPDVGRRNRDVGGDDGTAVAAVVVVVVIVVVITASPAPLNDARDRVGLLDVQVRVGRRRDLVRVVEERVRVRDGGLEPELVRDVVPCVAVVVDVELVQRRRVEAVVVRPAGRILERDVVREDRDGVRRVGADERIDVRVVDGRVVGDQRRLAVARRPGSRRPCRTDERRGRDRSCNGADESEQYSSPPHAFSFRASVVGAHSAGAAIRFGSGARGGSGSGFSLTSVGGLRSCVPPQP